MLFHKKFVKITIHNSFAMQKNLYIKLFENMLIDMPSTVLKVFCRILNTCLL